MYQWINNRHDKLVVILKRIKNFLDINFSGIVPESGIWQKEHQSFYQQLQNFYEKSTHAFNIENFDSSNIVRLNSYLLEEVYVFSDMLTQNSNNYNVDRTTISISLLGLKALAVALWPIMPNLTQQILCMLNDNSQTSIPRLKNMLEWVKPQVSLNYNACKII